MEGVLVVGTLAFIAAGAYLLRKPEDGAGPGATVFVLAVFLLIGFGVLAGA